MEDREVGLVIAVEVAGEWDIGGVAQGLRHCRSEVARRGKGEEGGRAGAVEAEVGAAVAVVVVAERDVSLLPELEGEGGDVGGGGSADEPLPAARTPHGQLALAVAVAVAGER